MTDKEKIDEIEWELSTLDDKDLLNIANDFLDNKDEELIYYNNRKNIIDLFNNNLEEYLDNLDNADDWNEEYSYIRFNGSWFNTYEELEDIINRNELCKFILANWNKYDYLFPKYIFDEE